MTEPNDAEATPSMKQSMSLEGDSAALAKFYDDWADSYDTDIKEEYLAPSMMVRTLTEAIDIDDSLEWAISPGIKILDAGCGTGLTGKAFAEAGYTTIDGVDLSAEMVAQARLTGAYRHLESNFDLNKPVPMRRAATYDLVTIGGVFTVGHVPPSALENVAALARPGGLIIASTRIAYYQETGYQEVADALEASGLVRLVHKIANAPYIMDSAAHYWAYRVEQ